MRTRLLIAALSAAVASVALLSTDATAVAPIRFAHIQYNSPGTDNRSNRSLNSEWVTVTNHAPRARSLTGWTIRDRQGHVYRFGTFTLGSGKTVRLRTGKGTNTRTNVYWRQGNYVWNNTGDKAILRNRGGSLIDTCSWGNGPGSTNC